MITGFNLLVVLRFMHVRVLTNELICFNQIQAEL